MERTLSELEARLETALEAIGREKNLVLRYDRCVKELRAVIDLLNEALAANPFPGRDEEVRYFKNLAPRIYSQLFYYMKLWQVESWRPHAGREKFRQVLEEELRGIDNFFRQHHEICRYYDRKASHWDDHLFTRAGQERWPSEEAGICIGPDFTLGSYWASWILANDRYRLWLEGNLASLDKGEADGGMGIAALARVLPWKKSATDLVERVYAEWLAGCFGDRTLKEVMEFHAEAYGIDLTYFHSMIQELGRRKKNPTKHLDGVKGKLVEKLGEID